MANDLMETRPKGSEDPAQELEAREGVEDFGYSPSWQRSFEPCDPANASGISPEPPKYTLAQALNLLEVETAKRRLAEEGVREREERFRQMTCYLGKFLWLSDAATNKLIYVSPGYEQVWHTKREASYPKPEDWLEDTPPEAEGQAPPTDQAPETASGNSNEYQAVGPDGSLRWIRERMYPIQDPSGKPLYILGIAEDVTDLKALEAACQKNETMKRAFLRLVPDTVFKLGQDGTILEFKAAKDDPALRPSARLRGKNLSHFLPEPLARQALHSIQRAISTGRTQSLRLQYTIAGALRDFEVRTVACGDGEVLALARDVTGQTEPAPRTPDE